MKLSMGWNKDPTSEVLKLVSQKLKGGSHKEALTFLASILEYPAPLLCGKPDRMRDAVKALGKIASVQEDAQLAQLLEKYPKHSSQGAWLYKIGYALIDRHLHSIGATFLAAAHTMDRSNAQVLSELAFALESDHHHDLVTEVLLRNEETLETSYLCTYLLCYNSIMSGNLALADVLQDSLRLLQGDNGDYIFMTRQIQGILYRARHYIATFNGDDSEAVSLPETVADASSVLAGSCIRQTSTSSECNALASTDMRGWHYVINGSILLSSPFEKIKLSSKTSDGHLHASLLAADYDVQSLIRGVYRCCRLLQMWSFTPHTIWYLDDRESEVIANVFRILMRDANLNVRKWSASASQYHTTEQLIVAFNLSPSTVPDAVRRSLAKTTPHHLLYAHMMCLETGYPICADVVNTVYGTYGTDARRCYVVPPATGSTGESSTEAQKPMGKAGVSSSKLSKKKTKDKGPAKKAGQQDASEVAVEKRPFEVWKQRFALDGESSSPTAQSIADAIIRSSALADDCFPTWSANPLYNPPKRRSPATSSSSNNDIVLEHTLTKAHSQLRLHEVEQSSQLCLLALCAQSADPAFAHGVFGGSGNRLFLRKHSPVCMHILSSRGK